MPDCSALQGQTDDAYDAWQDAKKKYEDTGDPLWKQEAADRKLAYHLLKVQLANCEQGKPWKPESTSEPEEWKSYQGEPFAPPCQTQKGALTAATSNYKTAQQNFIQTKSSYWLGELKEAHGEVAAADKAYKACLAAHGAQAQLNATFVGAVVLRIAGKTFVRNGVSGPMTFYPPFHQTLVAHIGAPLTFTGFVVSQVGEGHGGYDPGTGALSLTLHVLADYTDPAGSDDAVITLSTESPEGIRMSPNSGIVWMSGSAQLGGKSLTVETKLQVDPVPYIA